MLSEIRERATGWIAWIIATIIVIPFAFWGVHQYFAGGQEAVVATVNGVDIEQGEYRRALDNRRSQMRQILGENFRPELVDSPEFKRGVLDDMISQVLLSHHAQEHGYRVGDEQLAETIRSNPRFQVGDEFSSQAYQGAVRQMGMTETGFESRLRQQLVLQQIRDGIEGTSFVTPEEQQRLLRLLLQKRRFDYAVLKSDAFVEQSEVADAEVQKEYQDNSDRYRTPEKMKVEYVELSVDNLAPSISVSDEDIQSYYQQHKEEFSTDPVRRASHILIKVAADADEQARKDALHKAQDLMEQLRNGADFAELAKEYSDDPGSASKGGDLGRVKEGDMVKPFEDALFSLDKAGALAGPVETRFGYHIIKLTEYEPAQTKPLAEVRDQIEKAERRKQAEALFLDRSEAFRNITYEQPQSLEPVADQLDLKIRQSDWFTRDDGSGVAANPKVRDAAFGEDVSSEGLNSEAIEIDINTLVVVRKLDMEPASLKPLDEVRGQIEQLLKRRKAREHVASLGPQLVDELKGGADWTKLLDEHGLTAEEATRSRAGSQPQGPDSAVTNAVFKVPEPSEGKSVYGGAGLPDGDYALFRLVEVIPGDPAAAPEEARKQVRSSLARRRGGDMLQEYLADLREHAEIKIHEDVL